jgi:GNAT superfamily N-acetyltransferase
MSALTVPIVHTPAPLVPRRAVTLADAEALRVIRNACRLTMTGHTGEIAPDEQRAWWETYQCRTMRIWLFDMPGGNPVGFGLLRPDESRWWATLGLLPEWRGRGYGVAIYRHLIAACPGDLWIDVLLTNSASARAAERAGFRLADWNGAVATLVARKGER